MRKLIFTLTLLVSFTVTNAQLYFKNGTNKKISVAIGWYNLSDKCWETKGWYNIEPNETINTGLGFSSSNDEFYYYAKGWEGDGSYKMLVANGEFDIKYASKTELKDDSNFWGIFQKQTVNFSFLEDKTFTLVFDENNMNPASKIQVTANLIFDDGGLSEFDIIDNKDVVLWNTSIGEGNPPVKPSKNTRFLIVVPEMYSNVKVIAKKDGEIVYESSLTELDSHLKLFDLKTVCCNITVSVLENDNIITEKSINYGCGE